MQGSTRNGSLPRGDEFLELPPPRRGDPRDVKTGFVVSDRNGYYDSQNVVAVGGGGETPPVLSVILHHSENHEGGPGLRLYTTRSTDRGHTWSPLVAIEESRTRPSHDGYQLVHRRPDGNERIYLFYGYNEPALSPPHNGAGENSPELPRGDMQLREGYFLRYSDDQAATWSEDRYVIPVRRTRIDRENPWRGEVMGMFMCDKPSVIGGRVYFAFQKTRDGAGETPGSEVFFLSSPDLLDLDDPTRATWETLPRGDRGLQAPGGALRLGEEPHVLSVSDHRPLRLFCLWRTETGRLAAAYSNDGGETWETPFWLTYEGRPTGEGGQRIMKNPRGSITPFRLRERSADGRSEFAMLFYNNGQTDRQGYCGRRVYWITVGRETEDGEIRWNQPEIALWWDGSALEEREGWNPDWAIVDGPGYPDWVEFEDGSLCFVESNKLTVRFHEVQPHLLAALRAQPEMHHLPRHGKVFAQSDPGGLASPTTLAAPVLPDLRSGAGFTLTLRLLTPAHRARAGDVLVSAMTTVSAALDEENSGETITKGYQIRVAANLNLELFVSDGFGTDLLHQIGRHASAGLWDGAAHTVSFIVDGGPKVVSAVVDEYLDNGGEENPQGWSLHARGLGEIGGSTVTLAPRFDGLLTHFLLYDRALLTSEAIAATRSLAATG